MGHDIFISYSSKEKDLAHEICNVLEKNNLQCWIAPRDIISGKNYPEQIVRGIKTAKVVVLVFSKNAQKSVFVTNEIDTAFFNNKPIISFKVDDTMPENKMEFFLKNKHWLEGYPKPEAVYPTLVKDAFILCQENQNVEYSQPDSNPFYDQYFDPGSIVEDTLEKNKSSVYTVEANDDSSQEEDSIIAPPKELDSNKDSSDVINKDSSQITAKDSSDVINKDSSQITAKDSSDVINKDLSHKTAKTVNDASSKDKIIKTKDVSPKNPDDKTNAKKHKDLPAKNAVNTSPKNHSDKKVKDLSPIDDNSGSFGGGGFDLSNYKIPIVIAAVILIAIVGFVAFAGNGNVESNSDNLAENGIVIDYIDVADDGESYFVFGSISDELKNSSDSVIHVNFLDENGNVITTDKVKINKVDETLIDKCLVGKEKVASVSVELYDAGGNLLSSAVSDNIK